MTMKWPDFPSFTRRGIPNYWDVIAFAIIIAIFVAIAQGARGMIAPLQPVEAAPMSLDYWELPYYALRTTLRMFAALAASFLFTFTYATLAAKSRRAEMILIPILDVLQSVPVLGFLSFTVTFFLGLFPGSTLGAEAATIFAIFTESGLEYGILVLSIAPYRAARSRRGGSRVSPQQLAALLVPRSSVRSTGLALEHNDVDVRRVVFCRRIGSYFGRQH